MVRTAGADLEAAIKAEDFEAAQASLTRVQRASLEAAQTANGPTWRVLSHTPVAGSSLRAVGEVARGTATLSEVARTGLAVLRGRQELFEDGAVDLELLHDLALDSEVAAGALQQVSDAGRSLDTAGLPMASDLGRQLVEQVEPLRDQAVAVAQRAPLLPDALGASESRRYLLLFQNNAEIRSTSGLPGSAAVLAVKDGRIDLERTFSPIVKTQKAGAQFTFTPTERRLYGEDLNIGAVFLNSMPDSSRVAELLSEGWRQWFPSERLDGVLTMDTVSLSYLLSATGPVSVGGVELDESNAVEELLLGAYKRLDSNEEQDAFFAQVAERVFTAVTDEADSRGLIRAGRRISQERRLALHIFDAPALDRELFPDVDMAVGINNISGDKMSYFLDYDVEAHGCDPRQLRFHMSSSAPIDPTGLPARLLERNLSDPSKTGVWHPVPLGSMLLRVVVRLPEGWVALPSATLGGESFVENGNSYWTGVVELAPNQVVDFVLPVRPADGEREVGLNVTAPIKPRQASGKFPTGCR